MPLLVWAFIAPGRVQAEEAAARHRQLLDTLTAINLHFQRSK